MLQKAKPYMLIIHLGGNSVVDSKQGTIIRKIEKYIRYLYSLFEDTIIVWSDILYRFQWQGIDRSEFKGMDKKRERMNRSGRLAVCKSKNGRIISHKKHQVFIVQRVYTCLLLEMHSWLKHM